MEKKKVTIRLLTNVLGETNGKDWIRYDYEMNDGNKYSTFDKKIASVFKPGMSVIMEGAQEGKYWKLNGMEMDEPEKVVETDPVKELLGTQRKSVKGSAYEKDPVGLAVEVFNVMFKADMDNNTFMPDARMEDAITAVKQAQEAFN